MIGLYTTCVSSAYCCHCGQLKYDAFVTNLDQVVKLQ